MRGDHPLPAPPDERKFDVFISYSRRDTAFVRRLQRALDNYTPPHDLPVPQRRLRTFRDESDFLGNEYSKALDNMLAASATLLVVCSPHSRASAYVGGEIATFAALRGKEHIVSVLVSGQPNNETTAADQDKAFHDELVTRLPVPLAADYRGWTDRARVDRDPFEGAWFKLLADIYAAYGVERSAVEGREKARQRRTRQIRTAVVSSVMLVLAALTVWALMSRDEAIRQGNTARSRFLAMQSMSGTHPLDLAMLLAVAAHRTTPTFEAWEALFVGLQRQPTAQRFLYGADATVQDIVVAGDGTCAAGWMGQRTIVWNLRDGTSIDSVPGRAMTDAMCRALIVASDTGDVELRPLADGASGWSAPSPGGAVTAWALDGSNTMLAVAHAGGRIVVRDLQTGRIRAERRDAVASWRYLRFSADGAQLAAIDPDDVVHRWDAGSLVASGSGRRCGAESANVFAISPDLRWCAAGREGSFSVTDISSATGEPIDLGTEWILALSFSPDGRTLMAGVQGGPLQFRSIDEIARRGREARSVTWSEHRTDITAAAYSSNGNALVSAARDQTVISWNPTASHRLISEVRVSPSPSALAIHANTAAVAIATSEGDVLVSGDGSAHDFKRVTSTSTTVTALAMLPSKEILVGTDDGRVLAVKAGATPRVFLVQKPRRIARIRANRDGTRAVVIDADGGTTLWDVATARPLGVFAGGETGPPAPFGAAGQAAFEPDGSRIAVVPSGGRAFLWQPADAASPSTPLPFQPTSFFSSVAFSGVNALVALGTGMYEEEVIMLDPSRSDAPPIARLPSHNDGKIAVTALAFSTDSRLLVSGLFDGSITVWDVAGRRRIGGIYPARGMVTDLTFADDGSAVTGVTEQGVVLRWDLNPDSWLTKACAIANRDVSAEERTRFLDGSAIAVCP